MARIRHLIKGRLVVVLEPREKIYFLNDGEKEIVEDGGHHGKVSLRPPLLFSGRRGDRLSGVGVQDALSLIHNQSSRPKHKRHRGLDAVLGVDVLQGDFSWGHATFGRLGGHLAVHFEVGH